MAAKTRAQEPKAKTVEEQLVDERARSAAIIATLEREREANIRTSVERKAEVDAWLEQARTMAQHAEAAADAIEVQLQVHREIQQQPPSWMEPAIEWLRGRANGALAVASRIEDDEIPF